MTVDVGRWPYAGHRDSLRLFRAVPGLNQIRTVVGVHAKADLLAYAWRIGRPR